jgi:hypothetical protein
MDLSLPPALKQKAQFELSHGCQKMHQTLGSVGKSTAGPTGILNAHDTAFCRGSFNSDTAMPSWAALANKMSASEKGYDSDMVDSAVAATNLRE